MVKLYCTHCGDIVRHVTVYVVRFTPIRATFYTRYETRHATRRTRPGFRPDVVTRADIFHRFATARARANDHKRHAAFWAAHYSIKA
jgi:hypothetical protein